MTQGKGVQPQGKGVRIEGKRGMSERATAAYAPRVVEGTQRHRAGPQQPQSVADGKNWPLAAMLLAGTAALYAPLVGFILVLVTLVSWQHLVVAGLLAFLLCFVPLFVVEVRASHRQQPREVAALLNRPASTSKRVRSSRLSSEDALGLVRLYAENESPTYEEAALRWLKRYIADGSPTLQNFAEITASLARCASDESSAPRR